ncbi:MAG: DUF6285 domain-containing protein [Alphaproteobacteria bacterium]
MSDAMKQAEALVTIALDTYAEEIAPELTSDKRYAGAMVASALGIAQRRLNSADPGDTLVESLGAGSIEALGQALRSGEISSASRPDLKQELLKYLEAELAITNPKFLERWKS